MQRHQRHARVGVVLVGVADQRSVVEKFSERFAALLRILRGVGEFLQVFNTREGFGRAFFFERADVSGAVDEEFDQLRQSRCIAGFAECRARPSGSAGAVAGAACGTGGSSSKGLKLSHRAVRHRAGFFGCVKREHGAESASPKSKLVSASSFAYQRRPPHRSW